MTKKEKNKLLLNQTVDWAKIDKKKLKLLLNNALEEEVGRQSISKPIDGDITTVSCGLNGIAKAKLVARNETICCGTEIAQLLFDAFSTASLTFAPQCKDGDLIPKFGVIATLEGLTNEILLIERTLLNFIQKLSGISTYASSLVKIIERYEVTLLDTRKTTPGYRELEKYATACGGSANHRMGLFDRILIKDNHLASKNIDNAAKFINFVRSIRSMHPSTFIAVEVDSVEFALSLTSDDVDAVLLDNFKPHQVTDVITALDNDVITEVSGGISFENIESYAACRPDFISTGAPTHMSTWADIGLDWLN